MKKKLQEYKEKRDFSKTKEPKEEKVKKSSQLRFVVQHHKARKDHYDFRLELGGVLKSWAVPKGPSYDPKDKRLAVMVEDHPLAYQNFEGTIPEKEYGGGTVMIWDEGIWVPLENPKKSLKDGNLKFTLYGTRLYGKWTLVHFKENNWLLIKEREPIELYSNISSITTSIRSGKTMEEIAETGLKQKVMNSNKSHLVEGITISNPDKIIFKRPKTTKYEIAKYYQKVSNLMLPYFEKRLISTIRCPDGIDGEQFYKKHFDDNNLGLVRVDLKTKKYQKEDYYYIENSSGIIKEVQMNSYEFHIWGSQVYDIDYPNILVFDLDPDESIGLDKVRDAAKNLKKILDDLSLKSYIKTSGGKGYHILVPTKKLKTWDEARSFTKDIAKLMETKWPDKYVSNVRKDKRTGKIFIDWIRNTRGATSVAPYSLRTKKYPVVSMPIKWNELDKIAPDSVTIEEALKRIKRKNPWEDFFEIDQ